MQTRRPGTQVWVGTGSAAGGCAGMGTGGPPGADRSTGSRGLQHRPMAMLTAAPGPKVPLVSLLSVKPQASRGCLLCCFEDVSAPTQPMGFLPPQSCGTCQARTATKARPAPAPRPGPRGGRAVTAAVPASLAPELPLPPGSRGCGTARPAAQPRLPVPGFWGTQDEDTSQAPPSEAALPLLCWLALGDL